MGKYSPKWNVIKVGSRFHHIQISDGEISDYHYNTREEAEKKCDEKNDANIDVIKAVFQREKIEMANTDANDRKIREIRQANIEKKREERRRLTVKRLSHLKK